MSYIKSKEFSFPFYLFINILGRFIVGGMKLMTQHKSDGLFKKKKILNSHTGKLERVEREQKERAG